MIDDQPTAPPIFVLDGVAKRYGALEALAPLSLTIAPGERVAVMGPSGSGKTTLLHLLAAIERPDAGRLTIGGRLAERLRPGRELAGLVGILPQGFDLVPSLAVVHNVLAGRLGEWGLARSLVSLVTPREAEQARVALARVGLPEKLYERTDRLSGGERQRVALARLLVQRPRVILADEPVSSVDPARAEDLLATMASLAAEDGQTLVASMHAVPLALRFFERVVALRRGRLVFDHPTAAITPAEIAALYELDDEGRRGTA